MTDSGDQDRTLGELDIIAEFFAPLAANTPGSLGLTDDAACLKVAPGRDLVVTSDMLVGGVHFFPDDRPEDIAWKAVAVNVSDLAAKGARPSVFTLALALPAAPTRSWLAGFASGLREAQESFGIGLAGGDTTGTPGPLTISITAIGETPADAMPRRSTARPGDAVYMTGTLGDAALGLRLRSGDPRPEAWGLDRDAASYLVRRYLRPSPRVAAAQAILEYARASMDISDGLVLDLSRLCKASGVGARIFARQVPLSPAARAVLHTTPEMIDTILTGGDDYEILATIGPDQEAVFLKAIGSTSVAVTKIGVITEGAGVEVFGPDGHPLTLGKTGYEHFT